MRRRKKIVIDTDPGVDDAMAVLYAANDRSIQLLGLTTVFGNVSVDKATRNALRLCELAGLDLAVAKGASRPSVVPPLDPKAAAEIHGEEGFGPVPPVVLDRTEAEEDAADFLARVARENPGEVTVCALGPITNLANTLRRHSDFAEHVASIVMMGGAVYAEGNVTPFAEANTFQDPHALAEVLASGIKVTVVGLDVTMKVFADRADFASLAARHRDHGGFLEAAAGDYISHYESRGYPGCAIHDPAAVIACVAPELFQIENTALTVTLEGEEVGRTVPGLGNPACVCVDVDAEALKARFFDTFELAAS